MKTTLVKLQHVEPRLVGRSAFRNTACGLLFPPFVRWQVLDVGDVQRVNRHHRIVPTHHRHDVFADHDEFWMRDHIALAAGQLKGKWPEAITQLLPNSFCVHGAPIAPPLGRRKSCHAPPMKQG